MKLYRQIVLLALTLLVFVSSTGISVGMHLCAGELQDIALFGSEADCPMEEQKDKQPACHKVPATDEAECCDDHTLVFEHDDAASDSKSLILTKTLDLKFVAAFKAVILQFFALEADPKPAYAFYEAPPLARDIPVLVQSFLL
ncbi:HYC_CC_PP family protein [Pontibacter populi]|uniref:Secreted protein n=1 Tax=Pontibacter populi TaxID=890055 RepID=A0ABV1RQP3_9BACT